MKKDDPIKATLESLLSQLRSDKSRVAYKGDWGRYIAWLKTEGVPVLEARPRHVKQYVAHLNEEKKARSTCGRALSVIREVYGGLVVDEVIETNPAREIKNPKQNKEPKTPFLKGDKMQQLLDLPATNWKERRARVCLSLLFGLGWRREEVAAMRVEDFKRDSLMSEVTGIVKGGKKLTVGVPIWVMEEIDDWLRRTGITKGAILPRSPTNRAPVSGAIIYNIVIDAAARAGFPKGSISPHGLRRTNITLTGELGVSLKERQLSVGHSSGATTERYDKATDASKAAPGNVFAGMIKRQKKEITSVDVFNAAFKGDSRYSSDPADIKLLLDSVASGAVLMQRIDLPPSDYKMIGLFTGKQEHQHLCSSVARWLEQQGKEWKGDAHHCCSAGGVADVVAADGSVFAECGMTRVDKVLKCLHAGQSILLVPYSFDEDVGWLLSGTPLRDAREKADDEAREAAKAFRWPVVNQNDDERPK